MKHLLLIFPKSFAISYGDMRFVHQIIGRSGLISTSLATVAAMTPKDWAITIVDENFESIDYGRHYDLVGITGFHTQIGSARLIGKAFQERGIPVVVGGPSVSVSPEHWQDFADILIIGEAERIWPRFMADFAKGEHKNQYVEKERFALTGAAEGTALENSHGSISPVPDFSGIPKKIRERYFGGIVQTSRGCPFDCEFCDVIVYVGRKMRYKPVDQVVAEVDQIRRLGKNFVVLADDNFSAGRKNSKKILQALKDYNRSLRNPVAFATQLSIDTAKDEEFLELAAEAGLNRVLIGLESFNEESLAEANKHQNIRADTLNDIRTFHEHGIMIMGTAIVGFDHDDISTFQQQLDFFGQTGILSPQPYPLQAPDGTPLKTRMLQEGRYRGWHPTVHPHQANNFNTFTLQPKNMTVAQLRDGILWLGRELYRPEAVLKRFSQFMDEFDASPKRDRLSIPKPRLDAATLGIMARLMWHRLTKASASDQKLLRALLARARRGHHPQAMAFGVAQYLMMKNVQGMLGQLDPKWQEIQAPSANKSQREGRPVWRAPIVQVS